ncbi:MAG TPA: helix-turn-helix domain-containing protein [Yinghuangia sp.]|uniref:helix-turn-helix domain-containing protein n=1 Tax=Yinghuangia sp. YIM S10712 TaxID=3436930 RepID=UPI002BF85B9B|nr:helix-turn-helix domain-containing protein [Yinghuangia sp.]
MTVVLDTAELPVGERMDAVYTAMLDAVAPCYVIHEGSEQCIHTRMEEWQFGRVRMLRTDSSGFRLVRTPRQSRQDTPPVIAVSVQSRTPGRHVQHATEQLVPPGGLMVADLSAPYDFSWSGQGRSHTVHVPLDRLGVSLDVVRRAMGNLAQSPLYHVVADHLRSLAADADRLADDSAALELGAATTELTRALLVSAGRDERQARAVVAETLLTRVRQYVRLHLTDPGLTPESIAAAHNISLRYLYKMCAQAGFSLHEWIIAERLRGARDELADTAPTGRTVAVVARRWGFTDPTHFGRRFRAEFGMTPGQWRRRAGGLG